MGLTAGASGRVAHGLTALRGALGFLSRLPVGDDERAWEAFRETPAALPIAGYVVGALLASVFVLPVPAPVAALVFAAWVYAVTGINHVDGLADLGDALVVHGPSEERRAAMKDTTAGVGAVLAVALCVAGLALAGLALAALSPRAAGVVLAAEVSAKLGMASIVCFGSAAHEGMGSQLIERAGPRSLALPALVAVPVALVTWPDPAALIALAAGVAAALVLGWWARTRLGGTSGDVIGAGNEVARLAALHAGVVAWTLW